MKTNRKKLLLRCFALLSATVFSAGFAGISPAADDPCDPAVLQSALENCGMDFVCIGKITTDFTSRCMEQMMPKEAQPAPGGFGESLVQQLLDQEGGLPSGDPLEGGPAGDLPGEWTAGAEDSIFDTTRRLHEETILSPSWLQTYQQALVQCGGNDACWLSVMAGAENTVRGRCGTNLMNEATVICTTAAKYEIHIEQAIAMQRLWVKGVKFKPAVPAPTASGEEPRFSPGVDAVPGTTGSPAVKRASDFGFGSKVSERDVRRILGRWNKRLESATDGEARRRIASSAGEFPLASAPGTPALVYEKTDGPDGAGISARPTRRDWAYSLTGILLAHAGFREGGERGRTLLDVAFWSMIQATLLNLEVEHLSNIGFFLNLKASLEEARDVLAYAHRLSPEHPDVNNNLSFNMAAAGRNEEASALQLEAARADPADAHIGTRLAAMGLTAGPAVEQGMPDGGDFGEAYFRLGKRHTLRQYWAGKEWFKAREIVDAKISGSGAMLEKVSGPHEWYHKRLKDISREHADCVNSAPPVLRGSPFGAFIFHPDFKDAPSPEEVERSRHNHEAAVCRCDANLLTSSADALSAYIDRITAVRIEHEKLWWPRLQRIAREWSSDIRTVNARYPETSFQFPVDAGYEYWLEEFAEDSEEFWDRHLPSTINRWHDLKTDVQNLKPCKAALPPLKKPPPTPVHEPEKILTSGINLFVVSFELRMDGTFKFNFDIGIIKGGYEEMIGEKGRRYEIGSGPIGLKYETNNAPQPGADNSRLSVTAGVNFFELVPGAGKPAATIMNQFCSFGANFEIGWGDRSGFSGQSSVKGESNFGFTTTYVTVPRYTRLQN